MAVTSADSSLAALIEHRAELQAWYDSSLNEADTRAKILDAIFREVLGWDENGIRREVRTTEGEYLDYILLSQQNQFVAEAKRSGMYFELPAGGNARVRRSGIASKSPSLNKALAQVADYCISQGVPVGVASNGLQFAVTLIYRPTQNSGYDTILFDGIDYIESHYVTFWNLLSPQGNAHGTIRALLSVPDQIRSFPSTERLLDKLHLPNETMNRNPLDVPIAPIIRTYFSDMLGDSRRNVLRQAYVDTERQVQYERQLDSLLSDHLPKLGPPVTQLITTRRAAPQFDETLSVGQQELGNSEGTVYLLVGGVGAGKTTFIHRYFQHLVSPAVADSILQLSVDFLDTSDESPDLSGFVDRQVLGNLQLQHAELNLDSWDTLVRIYEDDIAKLRRGVLKPYFDADVERYQLLISDRLQQWIDDTETHVGRVVRYLRVHHHKDMTIIFDNADQLGQDFQHRTLKVAFQKARVWNTINILALREETYWRFRNSPPFDAYHRYAYHIAAPRVKNVLAKRLALAKHEVGPQSISVHTQFGSAEVTNISIGEFLDIIIDSFLGKNEKNIKLLESLAANDIRQALDMFAIFLTSGHTNTDEYIKIYIDGHGYDVPYHHVLRAIALAERRHYDSTRSLIGNMFSLEDDGFFSHFQKLRILRYLMAMREIDAAPGRGFVAVDHLCKAFTGLITDEDGVRRVLDPLLQHRMVEAANGYRAGGAAADLVRITSAGFYYVDTLIRDFTYLDLVCTDTPIKSREWFEKMRESSLRSGSLARGIRERTQKVGLFLDYLLDEETSERWYLEKSALPKDVVAPVMPELVASLSSSMQEIVEQAQRYGRDRPRSGDPV